MVYHSDMCRQFVCTLEIVYVRYWILNLDWLVQAICYFSVESEYVSHFFIESEIVKLRVLFDFEARVPVFEWNEGRWIIFLAAATFSFVLKRSSMSFNLYTSPLFRFTERVVWGVDFQLQLKQASLPKTLARTLSFPFTHSLSLFGCFGGEPPEDPPIKIPMMVEMTSPREVNTAVIVKPCFLKASLIFSRKIKSPSSMFSTVYACKLRCQLFLVVR